MKTIPIDLKFLKLNEKCLKVFVCLCFTRFLTKLYVDNVADRFNQTLIGVGTYKVNQLSFFVTKQWFTNLNKIDRI